MRKVAKRSIGVQVLTVLVAFLAGPLVALGVSYATAPDLPVVTATAPLGFAAIFFFGLMSWLGIGLVTTAFGWLMRRRDRPDEREQRGERIVPRGYGAFLVFGLLIGCAFGFATGLLSDGPFLVSLASWSVAGLGYGSLLSFTAHHGFLPFPEDD